MPTPEKREMTFDFDGLIQLLAGHLYSEKRVFIRELVQNAHDAIQRRLAGDPAFDRESAFIDIITDLGSDPARMIVRDNGIGMSSHDLHAFLSTIGRSGTRQARDDEQVPDVIGQFGIGFLSGFVVGKKVEVRTRRFDASAEEGCLWENDGSRDYTISPCHRDSIGTEVTVYLRSAEDRGLLHEETLKKVIRTYADMLLIPIHVNDPGHHNRSVNTRIMPWERGDLTEEDLRLECLIYLEKSVPDSVLEVIPVNEHGASGPRVSGLLYVTTTRVLAVEPPRMIRVFQKRMFLCDDARELLPPWASFVNGIFNTPDLSPNAARDNFARDEHIERLRDRLGEIIVQHFERLKVEEPERLSRILAYHDLGIKSACYHYEPFFEKFGHLLEWRINAKSPAAVPGRPRPPGRRSAEDDPDANNAWATLPEIIRALPDPGNGACRRLSCFRQGSSANQYFEMADAAGTTVVDASYVFEEELLKSYLEKKAPDITLVYVDREDDPDVFRDTDPEQDQAVRRLANVMSALLRPGGSGRIHVEARRFEPAAVPAVLKESNAGQGAMKARSILDDPNSPSDLRRMAEEMIRMSRNADMRMTINAGNDLIRKLALLDSDDEDVRDLMLGIYNDAILYNTEMMTVRMAQLFHQQFQRLITRNVEFILQKSELARARAEIERLTRQLGKHDGA